jgi:deoxyribodipyrimidine photo-lyase
VPDVRIVAVNRADIQPTAGFVLYWMIAARRPFWNFGLQRAVEWARTLSRPLVVLEALRAGYPWASDRLHAFVLQGMADNARYFASKQVAYLPYVEPSPGEGHGLLACLAGGAAVVVTDDHPGFFLRRMVAAAGGQVSVRLESVDSSGLLPLRASEHAHSTAHSFRSFLQKHLRAHLPAIPQEDPLTALPDHAPAALPREVLVHWPVATLADLDAWPRLLGSLPIDHRVPPVAGMPGGHAAARARLHRFLAERLGRYAEDRNQPELDATSGLSPYLHFGHVSAHEIFSRLMTQERWTSRSLDSTARGAREGWWGVSRSSEAFLDQLVTWREVGFNMCHHRPDFDRYESLPSWARATLDRHAGDRRAYQYGLEPFESARTHDRLWNAAQGQLLREGHIHNYLRMLWGKKILEWTAGPREALDVLIELNNKYALDGRDPNSYSGIFWVLGRYDRPWGPERPIFGTVRYMSSENTARKLRVRTYIERYAA